MNFRLPAVMVVAVFISAPAVAAGVYSEPLYRGDISTSSGDNDAEYGFQTTMDSQPVSAESVCVNDFGLTAACSRNDIAEGIEVALDTDLAFGYGFQSYAGGSYSNSVDVHTSVGDVEYWNVRALVDFDYFLFLEDAARVDFMLEINTASLGDECYGGWAYEGSLFGAGRVAGGCAEGTTLISGTSFFAANERIDYLLSTLLYGGGDRFLAQGIDLSLSYTITTVPVPAAVWLFGSGLGLLGWFRRKA